MLSTTSQDAIKHWSKALEIEPFHHAALTMRTSLLLLLGRFEEASFDLDTSNRLFPRDVNGRLLRAVYLALRGQVEEARLCLEETRPQLRDAEFRRHREILTLFEKIRNFDEVTEEPLAARFVKIQGWIEPVLRALASDQHAKTRSVPLAYLPPSAAEAYRCIPMVIYSGITGLHHQTTVESVNQVYRQHPDAFLIVLRGILEYRQGRHGEAEASFTAAGQGRTFVPITRMVLYHRLSNALEAREKADRPQWDERIQGILRQIAELGNPRVKSLEMLCVVAVSVKEFDLARWFVYQWDRRDPKNDRRLLARGYVEKAAGGLRPARKAVKEFLSRQPRHEEGERLLKGIDEAMKLGQNSIGSN
jgi:hypothetical protein